MEPNGAMALQVEGMGVPVRTRRAWMAGTARLALGLGATALMAACGAAGEGGAGTAGGKVAGKVSLLYYTSTEPAIDRMKKQEAGFKEKFPDVQLTVEAQPTAFTDKITTLLAAGTPPDVHWIGADFWRFVGQGVFVDLDAIVAKDRRFNLKEYYAPTLQAFAWPDKLRALPYGVNTHPMTFNKRIFQQEGVPLPTKDWTVAQFTDLARRFTKDTNGDGAIDQAGFGNWPHLNIAPHLFGGGLWDKGFTKATLDSPESVAGLEWLYDIQFGSRKVYPPTEMLQGTNLNQLMGTGKIAFFSTGRFSVPVLRGFTDLDWDMVVYPTGPTGKKATFMSGESFAMNTAAKDRDAAWKLMEYLCGRESQEQFYLKEGSVIPAIRAVAESRGFSDAVPGKNHKAHLDSIDFGVQPFTHPVSPDTFTNIMNPLWGDVTAGKLPAKEMARQATTRMNELLRQWQSQQKK
jgi:multiple sugar transport system substrate-binding protein